DREFLRAGSKHLSICNQAGLRGEDAATLDQLETVFAQRRTAGREVGDDVGVAHCRRDLERAMRLDEGEIMNALLVEVLPDESRILRCDPELTALLTKLEGEIGEVSNCGDVDPGIGHGKDELATAVAKLRRD